MVDDVNSQTRSDQMQKDSVTGKVSKSDVNFQQAPAAAPQKCMGCLNFDGTNQCSVVMGTVSPSTVCDLWQDKEVQPGAGVAPPGVPPQGADMLKFLVGG